MVYKAEILGKHTQNCGVENMLKKSDVRSQGHGGANAKWMVNDIFYDFMCNFRI